MSPATVSSETMTQVARSVLTKNAQLRKGETLAIEGFSHTIDWAVAFAREARHMGALPVILYEDEEAYWDAIERGEEGLLGAAPPHEWALLGKTDVYLHMWGFGDKPRFEQLPPKRRERVFAFNDAWYAAARKAGLRGFRLELGRPYPSLAQSYGVDEQSWIDQIISATLVDPAALRRAAEPIARALQNGRKVRIRDDQGTDLSLALRHRRPRAMWGRINPEEQKRPFGALQGLPSGSVRVAVDETVADGTFIANRSSYNDFTSAVGGVLQFEKGRLIDHHFERGAALFDEGFAKGGKGRDQPSQLGIGLNPGLHNTPQVEDLEKGAIMVAVGGNRFIDGRNRSPFFGFAINVGARVEVDGRPLPGLV